MMKVKIVIIENLIVAVIIVMMTIKMMIKMIMMNMKIIMIKMNIKIPIKMFIFWFSKYIFIKVYKSENKMDNILFYLKGKAILCDIYIFLLWLVKYQYFFFFFFFIYNFSPIFFKLNNKRHSIWFVNDDFVIFRFNNNSWYIVHFGIQKVHFVTLDLS